MAFNVAQGFKDIANKLINGLPLENGGTGATTREQALINVCGFRPSSVVLFRNYGSNTSASTSYNYFHASFGDSSYWSTNYQRGHLSSVEKSITWGDRTQTNTCIKVADDAPSGHILVCGNVRYLKNTSTASAVQTALVHQRDGVNTSIIWITGTYGNVRISQNFCQVIGVQPGDIFFLGGYKGTASHDVEIVDGISTRWGAIWLGNDYVLV